jgi:hypothetical protein
MNCNDATKSNRKSGEAKWRDLQFYGLFLEMFLDRATRLLSRISGAGDGDRTRNQRLGKPLLYH